MNHGTASPLSVSFSALDGFALRGAVWRLEGAGGGRPVVVINPATSVRSNYYGRFAAWLSERGFDVLSYDYRGIGESRPEKMTGFDAGWLDWGRLDFEGALQYAQETFPGQAIHVVGHSVGGFLVGMAASSHRVSRVFTMGAQYAYWRDYARDRRAELLLKWHVVMPALTALFGYFPGKRLGWLEDTPRGVVRDWTARHPRFEDALRGGDSSLSGAERADLVGRFAAVRADMLALSVSDDEFGTVAAIQRLLGYYRGSARTHLHLTPADIGQKDIGHFAFFHSRFQHTLWPIALEWLRHGRLPLNVRGEVLTLKPDSAHHYKEPQHG